MSDARKGLWATREALIKMAEAGEAAAAVCSDADSIRRANGQVARAALELIDGQAVKIERLRKDAERYRWLRDKSCPPHNFYVSVPVEFDGLRYTSREVDEYIDAARKEADRG